MSENDDLNLDDLDGGLDESENFRKVREYAKRQKARVAELQATIDTRDAADAESKRVAGIAKVFETAGLKPASAKLFAKANAEVPVDKLTAEAITAFAEEYGLTVTPPETSTETTEEATGQEETKPAGFQPVSSQEATAPKNQYSRTEWLDLQKRDQAAAEKAFKDGKVDLSDVGM